MAYVDVSAAAEVTFVPAGKVSLVHNMRAALSLGLMVHKRLKSFQQPVPGPEVPGVSMMLK